MQREILFRVWCEDSKQYLKGDFSIGIESGEFRSKYGDVYKNVVIEQFTGLTDKNGNRIFEGDKLKTDAFDYTYIVEFTDNAFNCYHETLKEWDGSKLKWGGIWRFKEIGANIEVIGNIHD